MYAIAGTAAKDIFTGERFDIDLMAYFDGTYTWGNRLTYYVEHYNLRPSDGFAEYVIEKLGLNKAQ